MYTKEEFVKQKKTDYNICTQSLPNEKYLNVKYFIN